MGAFVDTVADVGKMIMPWVSSAGDRLIFSAGVLLTPCTLVVRGARARHLCFTVPLVCHIWSEFLHKLHASTHRAAADVGQLLVYWCVVVYLQSIDTAVVPMPSPFLHFAMHFRVLPWWHAAQWQ